MKKQTITPCNPQKAWGEFRFSVVGGLLAAPPEKGTLKDSLKELAQKNWRHPLTQEQIFFSWGTIENWYYVAKRNIDDPVGALSKQPRRDRGKIKVISEILACEIKNQYERYPFWSVKLHYDNLNALIAKNPNLGKLPSYSSLLRFFKDNHLARKKRIKRKKTKGVLLAEAKLATREIRSYEMDHVGSLWHLDFHVGSRKIQHEQGRWKELHCLAIHDDHSRIVCHIQWYWAENTKNLVHGVCQAILKRGKPWAIMSDNGAAMKSDEFISGLSTLGINHDTTLPYSAYQNGKTERFWAVLEGRLMAMLDGMEFDLEKLNMMTLAWVETEHNRAHNKEINCTPYDRYKSSADVSRCAPTLEALKLAFRQEVTRKQRKSDGTVSVEGKRFEVPFQYRKLDRVRIRFARWDMSFVHMVDRDGISLARLAPQDKSNNAHPYRRQHTGEEAELTKETQVKKYPPLLERILADFSASGLPAPYLAESE